MPKKKLKTPIELLVGEEMNYNDSNKNIIKSCLNHEHVTLNPLENSQIT